MAFRFNTTSLPGGCGFTVPYNIDTIPPASYHNDLRLAAGTGICVVSLVDTPECHEFYEDIVSKYQVLYQSPTKRNRNSGRDCFLLVFQVRN